jgi:hypothetical protein
MSATTATLRGRLAAEANMVDACTIQRVTGTSTNDTIASDDLVTITASLLDADLVGRTFRVRELGHKSHMTARRVQLEEVTS